MSNNTTGTITGDLKKAYGSGSSPFKESASGKLLNGAFEIATAAAILGMLGAIIYATGWLLPIAPWAPAAIELTMIKGPFENGLVWVIDALLCSIVVLSLKNAT